MSFLKKNSFVVLAFILLLTLSACSDNDDASGDGSSGESYEWSVGFNTVEDSLRGEDAKDFNKLLDEESDGRISFELFSYEAIGTYNAIVAYLSVGVIDDK